jgi:hypothetical protein
MAYPTFWFSNSGLTLQIILDKLCCFKKLDPSIDYEWDVQNEPSYIIQNVQPIYLNKI